MNDATWELDSVTNEDGIMLVSDGQPPIALIYKSKYAKLIAAAPELLRQLQIAIKHIKNIEAKYKPEHPFATGEYEAAIKKATL